MTYELPCHQCPTSGRKKLTILLLACPSNSPAPIHPQISTHSPICLISAIGATGLSQTERLRFLDACARIGRRDGDPCRDRACDFAPRSYQAMPSRTRYRVSSRERERELLPVASGRRRDACIAVWLCLVSVSVWWGERECCGGRSGEG